MCYGISHPIISSTAYNVGVRATAMYYKEAAMATIVATLMVRGDYAS